MVTGAGRAVVVLGAAVACSLAVHTAVNLARLRRPVPRTPSIDDDVAVLIPARNEAPTIAATVHSATTQTGVPRLRVFVMDDGSTDGTAAMIKSDPRVHVLVGPDATPPDGWLGKPWACARLADAASDADVLVFVDADVTLASHAVHALVDTMRTERLALVAPFPRQRADTWPERLVQPLVTWLWAATLPLAWAERSARPSLAAANGQLLAFDVVAYRSIGGHAAVRGEVLDDVALMRAFRSAGHRAATVDGSQLADCRMYDGVDQIVDGYAKSLWSAFGGPMGAVVVCAASVVTYVVPPLAMVFGRRASTRAIGATGYLSGVVSRALVAQRTGEPTWPDTALHPLSMVAFVGLVAVSWQRHLTGRNRWKGRPVEVSR